VTPAAPASRDDGVARLLAALGGTTGEVALIGSLARPGGADAFSDIDVRWDLPPGGSAEHVRALRSTLGQVGSVESLRVDPEPRSDMLLVFARFVGWPLWWRVDLELHASGIGRLSVPGADAWSPDEAACMGVVVTLKALARHRPEQAEELWAAARRRVDPVVEGSRDPWPTRIEAFLARLEANRPALADLVSRIRLLAHEVLPGPPHG